MATRIQLDMFADPPEGFTLPEGFVCEDLEIIPAPPKVESNATEKRNKRRAWYLQAVVKKHETDGSPMA